MPPAANWFPPDLNTNGVLDKAIQINHWSAPDAAFAQQWYNAYLQAVWNALPQGVKINVINLMADALWHVHKDTHPDYDNYCMACYGEILNHKSVPNPHKATAADLAAVHMYYGTTWPIPSPYVACFA